MIARVQRHLMGLRMRCALFPSNNFVILCGNWKKINLYLCKEWILSKYYSEMANSFVSMLPLWCFSDWQIIYLQSERHCIPHSKYTRYSILNVSLNVAHTYTQLRGADQRSETSWWIDGSWRCIDFSEPMPGFYASTCARWWDTPLVQPTKQTPQSVQDGKLCHSCSKFYQSRALSFQWNSSLRIFA